MRNTLIGLVRENLNVEAPDTVELARLSELAREKGFQPTTGSLGMAIYNVRREIKGEPTPQKLHQLSSVRLGQASVELLQGLQEEIAIEVGFEPTMAQVVERLVKVYREKEKQ